MGHVPKHWQSITDETARMKLEDGLFVDLSDILEHSIGTVLFCRWMVVYATEYLTLALRIRQNPRCLGLPLPTMQQSGLMPILIMQTSIKHM